MQQTTNYNLLIPEGTDVVNPLTQVNPNFQTIDGAMFANKQATIGTASEVVTGTVHAIIRNNPDSDVFRFTATGAWTAGDTMTLDGQQVTVHLSDGTTPATNSYIIGAEVLAMVNGSLVTLAISTTPPAQGVTSFNSRTGAVVPAASDYDASMVDYDNTTSGLNATDAQGAIDEIVGMIGGSGVTITELWRNPSPTSSFAPQPITLASDNYKLLLFMAYFETVVPNVVSVITEKGKNATMNCSATSGVGVACRERVAQFVDNTTYNITAGGTSVGTQASVTNNNAVVPVVVYGINW